MRKFIVFLFFISLSLLVIATLAIENFKQIPYSKECSFCKKETWESQKVYENDTIICLVPDSPLTKGHVVILPKKHVNTFEDLSPKELIEMHRILKPLNNKVKWLYNTNTYILFESDELKHAHLHYIPIKNWDIHPLYRFHWFFNRLIKPFNESANRWGSKLDVMTLRQALNELKEEGSLNTALLYDTNLPDDQKLVVDDLK